MNAGDFQSLPDDGIASASSMPRDDRRIVRAQNRVRKRKLKAVAGLLGNLAVVVPPHFDNLAHLIEPGPQPDADPVDERVAAFLVERIACIFLFLGVEII